MTVNRNPSYDISGIAIAEMLAQQMFQDQREGVNSFVGGSQLPGTTGQTPTIGRITASYEVLNNVPGNLRAAAGISLALLPVFTTIETVTTLEKRLRAILDVLGRLQH